MHLGGSDRRRIGILQGRNRLKGAQNNILRLIGSSLVGLRVQKTAFGLVRIILLWLSTLKFSIFIDEKIYSVNRLKNHIRSI